MTPGNEPERGAPTCPPSARKIRPARYALSVYIAVLNTRCTAEGPRRTVSNVQAPTSAAPIGPIKTAAARAAAEPGDQVSSFVRSTVAVDSKIATTAPSTATSAQAIPPNGPRATITTVTITTVQI